jgi:hypothetical protein
MACVMFCFILSYSLWFLFLLLILSWKNNVQIKEIFIFFRSKLFCNWEVYLLSRKNYHHPVRTFLSSLYCYVHSLISRFSVVVAWLYKQVMLCISFGTICKILTISWTIGIVQTRTPASGIMLHATAWIVL